MATQAAQEKKEVAKRSGEQTASAVEARATPATPRTVPHGRRRRRPSRREGRVRSEFDQRIISIRRVARVVAGGRRFSFSVAVVVGNRRGSVGVGVGKASDTALAIEKAARDGRKRMITVPLSREKRIAHDVAAKYCASHIWLSPSPGRGLTAGGAVRSVLDLAGITDVVGKILSRSKNHLNNARATILALSKLQ